MRKQMMKLSEMFARALGWSWNHKFKVAFLIFVFAVAAPQQVRSQFVDPCCAIITAGLSSISSALTSVIGVGLNSILGVEQGIRNFEQTVVWPQNLINQARSLVGNVRGIFVQIQTITQVPVNSATLAGPQQLEQNLLSRDPAQIAQTIAQYQAGYGTGPTPTDASPEERDLIDSTDAAAQPPLTTTIQTHALPHFQLQAAHH